MAKGAFYPELFTLQLYLQSPNEGQIFIRGFLDRLQTALKQFEADKSPLSAIDLGLPNLDTESVVAIGSLVHEFVHYLQYTTRFLGFMFYECRYQQFLITQQCLRSLAAIGAPVHFPLAEAMHEAQGKTSTILNKWWSMWGPYQATIATTGLAASLEEEKSFDGYILSKISKQWNPLMHVREDEETEYKSEVSMQQLLETEAEIVTMEVLQFLFPDQWAEACDILAGGTEVSDSSLAITFLYNGISHMVPFLMDFAMQVPLHSGESGLCSPVTHFFSMLKIARQKYGGITREELLKNRCDIERTIGTSVGIEHATEALTYGIEAAGQSGISQTAIGKMLLRTLAFRRDHTAFFAVPYAFIFLIIPMLPAAVWVNYNLGIFYEEQGRSSLRHGFLPKGHEEFEAEFLRFLIWAAREIATRHEGYICPECIIKSRWSACSGNCGFIAVCRENFDLDLFKGQWIKA